MCREKFLSRSVSVYIPTPIPGYPRGVPGPSDREALEAIVAARNESRGDSHMSRRTMGGYGPAVAAVDARWAGQACGSSLTREFSSLYAALESARRLSVSIGGALGECFRVGNRYGAVPSDVTIFRLHAELAAAHERFAGHFGGGPCPGADPVEGQPYSFDTPAVRVVLTPLVGGRFRIQIGMAKDDSWTGFVPFRATSSLRALGLLTGWRLA